MLRIVAGIILILLFVLLSSGDRQRSQSTSNNRYVAKRRYNQTMPTTLEDSTPNVIIDFNLKRRQKYAKNETIAQPIIAKGFYQGRAIDFLREYGMYYHLFDQFFDHPSNIFAQKPSHGGGGFHGHWHVNESITAKHSTRDYDKFQLWNDVKSKVPEAYLSQKFHYVNEIEDDKILRFNNRYRYGHGINDRFLSIGMDMDPWTEASTNGKIYVYFLGYETALPKGNYTCHFHSPVAAASEVEIDYVIYNVLNKPTRNNLVRCPLPEIVIAGLSDSVRKIVLSLTQSLLVEEKRTIFGPKHQYNETTVLIEHKQVLLEEVAIPKVHSLDKRLFGYTIQTMIDNLDDPMVNEWIVYNILLGIEHFYIYYNTKISTFDLQKSPIKPFLDANIVTLIYFPFQHTEHFNAVQHVALNSYLHLYGGYSEWVGYWDVDEFFVPSQDILQLAYKGEVSICLICHIVAMLANDKAPAIMFDTLDMDCDEDLASFNYFHGGNNLNGVEQSPAEGDASTPLSTGTFSFTVSGNEGKPQRVAVTTHCEREGFLFHEMTHGHGKMLVRPAAIKYITSPHRLNHYWTVWTTAERGGLMRHFNRFRNTLTAMEHGEFRAQDIKKSETLRTFTFFLLHTLVGVSDKKSSSSRVV